MEYVIISGAEMYICSELMYFRQDHATHGQCPKFLALLKKKLFRDFFLSLSRTKPPCPRLLSPAYQDPQERFSTESPITYVHGSMSSYYFLFYFRVPSSNIHTAFSYNFLRVCHQSLFIGEESKVIGRCCTEFLKYMRREF